MFTMITVASLFAVGFILVLAKDLFTPRPTLKPIKIKREQQAVHKRQQDRYS